MNNTYHYSGRGGTSGTRSAGASGMCVGWGGVVCVCVCVCVLFNGRAESAATNVLCCAVLCCTVLCLYVCTSYIRVHM